MGAHAFSILVVDDIPMMRLMLFPPKWNSNVQTPR